MPVHSLSVLRNALVVTTALPLLWFALGALTVVNGVQITWLVHPVLVYCIFIACGATPLLIIVGFILGSLNKARAHPLPRLYFSVLLASTTVWLVLLGLFSLFPD